MEKKKRRINGIDIAVIVVLVLALLGVGFRFYMTKNKPAEVAVATKDYKKYMVSFIIRDKKYELLDYLKAGTELRFDTNNKTIGFISEDATAENAEKRYSFDGKNYTVINSATDEHQQRFDIRGTMLVEGNMNDAGVLFVKDCAASAGITCGSSIGARNEFLVAKIAVTSITEVTE